MVPLDESDHRTEGHTDQEKGPCQKNHEKVNALPPKDASPFRDLKDDIQRCPQGAEHPCGGPDQPSDSQHPNDFTVPNHPQNVIHNPCVEKRKGILQIPSYVV